MRSGPISTLTMITNNLSNGDSIKNSVNTDYVYNNSYINVTGKGVLVGVIDSGVDYLNKDLIDSNSSSKIFSIWDQTLTGNTPNKMTFGSEYTREDIDKAIKDNDSSLTKDNIGTGTMVCGIIAGQGNINPAYRGVATGCDLVVVKLREYRDTFREGRYNYSITDFLAGVRYLLDLSNREKKPLIINLSIGASSELISILSLLDTFSELSSSGVITVSGAGNEGNTDTHYSNKFKPNNVNNILSNPQKFDDIKIQISNDKNMNIIVNGRGPDKISALLISPSGEVSAKSSYFPGRTITRGKFNLEDTSYVMSYTYPFISSSSLRIDIYIEDIKPGVWTLRLIPDFIIDGIYNVYLPNKNIISKETRFTDPTSTSTITLYGGSNNTITIGAYNNKTDSLWIGSSKGPVLLSSVKPDIIAPGVDIISTYLDQTYNTITGTGVSASIVSGVLALICQYLIDQTSLSRVTLYDQVLKTYLLRGATKKDIYEYPNFSQGYGILDIENTFIQISNNI